MSSCAARRAALPDLQQHLMGSGYVIRQIDESQRYRRRSRRGQPIFLEKQVEYLSTRVVIGLANRDSP